MTTSTAMQTPAQLHAECPSWCNVDHETYWEKLDDWRIANTEDAGPVPFREHTVEFGHGISGNAEMNGLTGRVSGAELRFEGMLLEQLGDGGPGVASSVREFAETLVKAAEWLEAIR